MSPSGSSRPSDRLTEALRSVPWRVVLVDLAFVVVWVLAVSLAFRIVDAPIWLYYLVAFGGVIAYSLAR
ncbi:hypothetical protein [Natronorarus salvus]|uniref:hypothetical protein n=1 Tax=Natronorarus salvus TaxID=3117733 RepID=UPI002F2625D9